MRALEAAITESGAGWPELGAIRLLIWHTLHKLIIYVHGMQL